MLRVSALLDSPLDSLLSVLLAAGEGYAVLTAARSQVILVYGREILHV